jgi:hypothetical protein
MICVIDHVIRSLAHIIIILIEGILSEILLSLKINNNYNKKNK